MEDFPEERVDYLEKDLGDKIPSMAAEFRTEANRVHGCKSTVYLHARQRPGTADVVEFVASSDSSTVRGLIYILQRIYSGQKARQILTFDVEGFFARLRLDQLMTTRRRIGLDGMMQRIRNFAATLAARKE